MHLNADQLAAHIDHRLRGTERDEIVAHLVECADCRREYADASRMARTAVASRRRFRPAIVLATAAALAVVFVPRARRGNEDPGVRATTQRMVQPEAPPVIRVVSPQNAARLTGQPVVLTWHADAPNTLYHVTVHNAEGSVVWRKSLNDTTATIPADVSLADGGVYYWVVDALHADGRSARSTASNFRR